MDESRADSEPNESAQSLHCPHCGEPIDRALICGPVAQCPRCRTQFFAPATDANVDAQAEEDAGETTGMEDELDALRIRQMSALRRTAYRTRTYFIVGFVACAAAAINLVYYAFNETRSRHRFTVYSGLYICLALAAFIGSWKFLGRAMQIHRDIQAGIKARELEEREISRQERDFSALSDGSHQAKNLEQLFDPDERRGG